MKRRDGATAETHDRKNVNLRKRHGHRKDTRHRNDVQVRVVIRPPNMRGGSEDRDPPSLFVEKPSMPPYFGYHPKWTSPHTFLAFFEWSLFLTSAKSFFSYFPFRPFLANWMTRIRTLSRFALQQALMHVVLTFFFSRIVMVGRFIRFDQRACLSNELPRNFANAASFVLKLRRETTIA